MLCGTSLHRQAALRAGEQRHRCAAAANAQSAAPRPVRVSSRMSGGCLGSDQRLARHRRVCCRSSARRIQRPRSRAVFGRRSSPIGKVSPAHRAPCTTSIRSSVGAVQRWAWRPSRTRATTACMRAPGRWRACARGWYPRALVPQSTIEYRSSSALVVAPSPARAKSPAEKPGKVQLLGTDRRLHELRCTSANRV